MMSPRLPTRSRSERRMTFISDLVVVERAGVGIAARVERGVVTVAAGTAVTRRASALARYTLGVRQQRHLASELDRAGDVSLLLDVVARHTPVANLGPVAHET